MAFEGDFDFQDNCVNDVADDVADNVADDVVADSAVNNNFNNFNNFGCCAPCIEFPRITCPRITPLRIRFPEIRCTPCCPVITCCTPCCQPCCPPPKPVKKAKCCKPDFCNQKTLD